MCHGFMCLVAIFDVFGRRIMDRGASNTRVARCCAEIAREAFLRYGRSEIFNIE